MRLRLLAIAFLLGVLSTGLAWLSFQPYLLRLTEALRALAPQGSASRGVLAQAQSTLPLLLAVEVLLLVVVSYGVLYVVVARPLTQLEVEVERLAHDEKPAFESSSGPLWARFRATLRSTSVALDVERRLTRSQLAALQQANARLTEAQAEIVSRERLATVGRLAAGVAHEVGNPLSGILGFLSIARHRPSVDEALRSDLVAIETEVLRISAIVRQLVDLGAPTRPSARPVPVRATIESTVSLLRNGPEFSGVRVDVDVPPDLVALADPGPLGQVLINLLLNAAQAISGDGTISIRARPAGGQVAIDVQDSGPGVPAELRERIFEPFFTTKSGGKGTGLGLAVTQHLVRAMSGDVAAGEGPQGGGKFTVSLPAVL